MPHLAIVKKTGVVAEYDGKFWGSQFNDGHACAMGFGPIENAELSDPQFCHKPEDKTWKPSHGRYNPDYEELKKAKLVHVEIVTTYTKTEV